MTNEKQTQNRALFYLRDSGGKHETTPGQYVQWAIKAAQQHNVSFNGTAERIEQMIRDGTSVDGDLYLDYVVSGVNLSRPALDALIRDAVSNSRVTHIFIPKRDRLARPNDPMDGVRLEQQLREAGNTLVFMDKVLGPLSVGKRKDLGETITTLIDYESAGKFRRDLGEKMIYAQLMLANEGYSTGGRPPFGFRRWLINTNGKRIRQLEEGEIVRKPGHHVVWLPGPKEEIALALRIRRLLREMPASRVARILIDEGIPSPDAGRMRTDNGIKHQVSGLWHQSTVVNIGRNPLFTAVVRYGLRSMGDQVRLSADGPRDLEASDFDSATKKPKVIRNPETSYINATAKFDPLVDDGEHAELQKILDQRAGTQRGKPRSHDPSRNPLGCRIFDMNCGFTMYRVNKPKTFWYTCGLYQQSHSQRCSHNHVDGPTAARLALSCVTQKLALPSAREKLRARLKQLAQAESSDREANHEVNQCKMELKGLSSELETVSKNLARARSDSQYEVISREFEQLAEQKTRLEEKLKQLQTKTDIHLGGEEQVDRLLQNVDRLMELVEQADDLTVAKELFDLVNLRVFLRFEGKKLKKRTVNKVAGGMVTFGDADSPVKLYNGPTSPKQLKNRPGKRKKRTQNNDDDKISTGEDQSSRNVSRDDRI